MLTVATICARGGSRGVPGKNIRPLAGHPLLAYTIATARACPFVDRVVVSTDSDAIATVARAYGADVPFLRPAELATAEAGKIPVLQHAVRTLEAAGPRVDLIVDLDPTSPLRALDEVEACWRLAQSPETDIVFTVAPARKNPYFNMVELVDGYARLSKPPAGAVVRRQDAPAVYEMNASIYVWRRDYLLDDGRVIGGRSRIVEMPAERSRDVDSETDFEFLEFLVATGRVRLPEPGRVPPSADEVRT
jgi:CMP-N-acetylneuraminic acid synthetase